MVRRVQREPAKKTRSQVTKLNKQRGTRFENEVIVSLKQIPHAIVVRYPAVWKNGRYVKPLLDLLFTSSKACVTFECKVTENDTWYSSSASSKRQVEALKEFSRKGRFFVGVFIIYFMRKKKVVIVPVNDTIGKTLVVHSSESGYIKQGAFWPLGDYVTSYAQNNRKTTKLS